MQKHKFGVSLSEAKELYAKAQQLPNIDVVGIQCHIGSQITEIGPFEEALTSLREFILELKAEGLGLKYLDFGGGLGDFLHDRGASVAGRVRRSGPTRPRIWT